MYKEIGEYAFHFAMLMGFSVITHFIFNMGKIIYRGLVELDKVPMIVAYGFVTCIFICIITFVAMLVFTLAWPLALMLSIVCCLHPQVRCRILEGKPTGLQIVLFPVMIVMSLHIFLSELATHGAYADCVDLREI